MQTVFIFFGVGGYPEENWFPWLKKELEALGKRVIVPAFPNADHPTLAEWSQHFSQYREFIDDQTIFVGHSLGGAFALRQLEHLQTPIHATFLVASVSGVMNNEFDPLMTTFNLAPYDWAKIRSSSRHFSVIHADNDPYIALPLAEGLARHLGIEIEIVHGGGHFNGRAGYTTFPLLLEKIAAVGKA